MECGILSASVGRSQAGWEMRCWRRPSHRACHPFACHVNEFWSQAPAARCCVDERSRSALPSCHCLPLTPAQRHRRQRAAGAATPPPWAAAARAGGPAAPAAPAGPAGPPPRRPDPRELPHSRLQPGPPGHPPPAAPRPPCRRGGRVQGSLGVTTVAHQQAAKANRLAGGSCCDGRAAVFPALLSRSSSSSSGRRLPGGRAHLKWGRRCPSGTICSAVSLSKMPHMVPSCRAGAGGVVGSVRQLQVRWSASRSAAHSCPT